jgi:AraC-like DNA-binding protein
MFDDLRNTVGSSLPLVRLSLIAPFVDELGRRGIDAESVLTPAGLAAEAIADPDAFVHVNVVNHFLELAAEAAGDRSFGAYVGEGLDLSSWPPLAEAIGHARTLGDFLLRFITTVAEHASSARQRLEIVSDAATLQEVRTFEPPIVPAQNDGFGAGLWVGLIRRSMGQAWDPRRVSLTVADPAALPEVFHGIGAIRGDRLGYRIRFPARWLFAPFEGAEFTRRSRQEIAASRPSAGLAEAVRQALRPHVGVLDLDVEQAADLCRIPARTLGRKLAAEGTTLAREVAAVKHEKAVRELVESDRSIAEIAASVGFTDPTNFTHAFRRKTGLSPRAYRRQHAKSVDRGPDS